MLLVFVMENCLKYLFLNAMNVFKHLKTYYVLQTGENGVLWFVSVC